MSWPGIFKNVILKCCLLLFYATTRKHFSIGLWCAMKSGFYMTTGDDQLSSWTEKRFQSISQSQTCTTKRSWSLYSLQLSESWWNHYIWEVYSANQWVEPKTAMPAASIDQQNGCNSSPWRRPTTHCKTNTSKVEWTGLQSFASFIIFTWPLANWLALLQVSWQLFAGKTLPQPTGGRKCFPGVCWILKHKILCYRSK